ncbi:thioredoxin-like protein [Polychytrium aggregatum]|uniref:thioredoxin-like protein n=1 Tax=Polychytrium aggregatum TaxID=110093 RepID=UPI0022FDBBDF|nr:thioredoxin-like protein [Polychytrium aggregatum]KAI9205629.1 thioredoxin-like protein [Polychytrium aggregatum]
MPAALPRPARIEWYFDFISPYSYLQFHVLKRKGLFQAGTGCEVILKPIVFGGLLDHWKQRGPAEIPPKRVWTYRLCQWLAYEHQIPLTMPSTHPFNSLPLLRLCVFLGPTPETVERLFQFVWRDGYTPTEPQHQARWADLLCEMQVASPELIHQDSVKIRLRQNFDDAVGLQLFGVPSAVVHHHPGRNTNIDDKSDNKSEGSAVVPPKVFFGFDATTMMLAYLAGDSFFVGPESPDDSERLDRLPQAHRKGVAKL